MKFSECRQTVMTTNIVFRYRNSGVIVQDLVPTAALYFFFLLPPMLTCCRSTCCSALHRASQYGNLQGRHHQVVLQPYEAGMHALQLRWLPREWQQIQHWGAVHEFLPRRNRLVCGEQTLCTPACGATLCFLFAVSLFCFILCSSYFCGGVGFAHRAACFQQTFLNFWQSLCCNICFFDISEKDVFARNADFERRESDSKTGNWWDETQICSKTSVFTQFVQLFSLSFLCRCFFGGPFKWLNVCIPQVFSLRSPSWVWPSSSCSSSSCTASWKEEGRVHNTSVCLSTLFLSLMRTESVWSTTAPPNPCNPAPVHTFTL